MTKCSSRRADVLMSDGDDLRKLPLSMRKTSLARLLARRVNGIFLSDFEQGEIGPDLFHHACLMGLEGLVSKRDDLAYRAGVSPNWIKIKNPEHPAITRAMHSDEFGAPRVAEVHISDMGSIVDHSGPLPRPAIDQPQRDIDRMKREPQGLIYTILIEDKAMVALQARGSEARELCKEEWFREELSRFKSNGEPLYRPGLRVRARPATEDEWIRYDKACSALTALRKFYSSTWWISIANSCQNLPLTSPTTMLLGSAAFVQTAIPHSRNDLTINTPRRHRIRRRKCPLPVDGSGLPQRARCTPCRRKRREQSAQLCFQA